MLPMFTCILKIKLIISLLQQVACSESNSDPSDNPVTVLESAGDMDNRVAIYEELFKERFSEEDDAYMATVRQPLPPQPCVLNWYTRPKRTFDWARQRG